MLGVYDYTVILTYISTVSAGLGTLAALAGGGHPYIGAFCLLICGLCDGFDGKVARTKKDRTEYEKKFGIQIDSLTDILAFGMLPAAIAGALLLNSEHSSSEYLLMCIIMMFYLVTALARLAHFNVTEEERQDKEAGPRKYYEGLPVTFSSLIFPSVLLFQYVLDTDLTVLYFLIMTAMGFMFISRFRIKKPLKYGIAAIAVFFVIEAAILLAKIF